jgi:hypothetical protein
VVPVAEIDRAPGFGQPQLDAMPDAPGVEGGELGAGEGAFILADHDRVDRWFRAGDRCYQSGGLGSLLPWDAA